MQLTSSFPTPASPEETYRLLLDVRTVGECFPGAEVGEAGEDGSHPAKVTVRLGPMRLVYEGTIRVAERDEDSLEAVLLARAREVGGQGGAEAAMRMRVAAAGQGASVEVETELALSGRAAQMGRGIVEEVARLLVSEMASCLETRFPSQAGGEGPEPDERPPARPIRGLSLVLAVFANKLRRLVKGEGHA